jgi:hypothetical protein
MMGVHDGLSAGWLVFRYADAATKSIYRSRSLTGLDEDRSRQSVGQ